MSCKMININVDNLIELYKSGKSIQELRKVFNCSQKPITRILRENGIAIRNPNVRKDLPIDEIISLYTSGISINELAIRFSVGRPAIVRRLNESGVIIRGQTQANQLMMSKRTPEENARNIRAFHDTIRGKPKTHEELCKRAIGVEKSFTVFHSFYEAEIAKILQQREIFFIPQKAVDKYNVDFAIFDNIALEICGGGYHSFNSHKFRFNERSKKLFDCGYTIVVCWVIDCYFIPTAIVDYCVALNKILCSDPTSRCKHYVIRGDGQTTTFGSNDFEYIS